MVNPYERFFCSRCRYIRYRYQLIETQYGQLRCGSWASVDVECDGIVEPIETHRCCRCGHGYTSAEAIARQRHLSTITASPFVCDQPDANPKSGFKKCGGFIRPAAD